MEFIKMKLGTSLFYYIYIILCAGAFAALYFGLRHKSEKTKFWTLYGILAFNFVLHFLKLALPYYYERGFPEVLRKCSFENICAVSTLVFPFAYLSKCNSIKDYMFYLGVISGIRGCVAPMPVIGLPFYHPEVIRYYICHASIWIVPLLMVIFGIHKLDYRRIWKVIAIYFGVLPYNSQRNYFNPLRLGFNFLLRRVFRSLRKRYGLRDRLSARNAENRFVYHMADAETMEKRTYFMGAVPRYSLRRSVYAVFMLLLGTRTYSAGYKFVHR